MPLPIILMFSPCGSEKTLAFMKWLGIAFPRWLENELRLAADPLAKSLELCERIFAEVWDYARDKDIPLGVNVESVSIRKTEIEASVELLQLLRRRIDQIGARKCQINAVCPRLFTFVFTSGLRREQRHGKLLI